MSEIDRSYAICTEEKSGRLDVFLASMADISRSRAGTLIKDGWVFVDHTVICKPSFIVMPGMYVSWTLPEAKTTQNLPQDLPLSILYEDDDLAIIEKPEGMVVHPGAGNSDGTLVNALLFHLSSLSGIGGEMRPGIVHRLDKDTSGLMLVAKNDKAHAALSAQLAAREIEKHYRAAVFGHMKDAEGCIDLPIGRSKKDRKKMAVSPDGKSAVTLWKVLAEKKDATYLDVHILTGRTHQIRVHMRSAGHPVLGDSLYGFSSMPKVDRLMLHAYSLSFHHPVSGQAMTFTSECPFEHAFCDALF